MKYVEIVAEADSSETVSAIAEQVKAEDLRLGAVAEDGMRQMRMLVTDNRLQPALDLLQNVLGARPTARILVLDVEATLPKPQGEKRDREESASAARESLYEEVEKSTRLDANYLVLVALSTVVAAIGLIEGDVAVVVGAMVIAPLLGPNLALSLGTALGDFPLVRKSAKTLLAGIALAVVLSAGIGALMPADLTSPELMSRTDAGLESVALALASGAAAALSLTTGLSSVLVGVMVAVGPAAPSRDPGHHAGPMGAPAGDRRRPAAGGERGLGEPGEQDRVLRQADPTEDLG